ncbi:MAG TPA: DUF6252 family protein [Flavobacterium sp.]|uniref:DUF6252 family protein n=1 Tax=Flavobacterium sp. TaxID=239 RepID=UPI002F3EFBC5
MKKQILLILALFSLISCVEDVSFNNPSFQGVKDNVFWRAIESKASLDPSGSLVIEAYSGSEVITLKTTSTAAQTYVLGTSTSKTATYVRTGSDGTITFATGTGIGDGQISITEYDPENNTVTGTFKFNAENIDNNPSVGSVLNFQQGVFYKVPIR